MMKLVSLMMIVVMMIGVAPKAQAGVVDELLAKVMQKVTEITGEALEQIKTAIAKEFKDYSASGWYANYIAKLVGVGAISGYPDKTIKVNGTITRAEFLKILVASIYGTQIATDTHWASGYVKKAEAVGILSVNEINVGALNKPITRQEMAKMIILASEKSLSEAPATNLSEVETMIFDSNTIGSNYKTYVLSAYSKGIIEGYPDKTFGPLKTATRAEASTMMVKLLDSKERTVPGTAKWKTIEINGFVMPAANDKSIIDYTANPESYYSDGNAPVVAMYLDLWGKSSLIDQWTAVEQMLSSKFDVVTVKTAMDYIKLKTIDTYNLKAKELDANGMYIFIGSNEYNSMITIQIYLRK